VKKDLNFEINILPILDILSVMICFLLLTAVWVQVGTMDVKQAIGDNSASGDKNPPSIWATLASDGSVQISLRDIKVKMPLEYKVSGVRRAIDWATLTARIQTLKARLPELKTAVIRPEGTSDYGDVIKVMDQLKQNQITDIGLSPLG
jgi:biopolymer transport protein ExbD